MPRRFIPVDCARCGARVPRAAAGRCPSCRTAFTPAFQAGQANQRQPLPPCPAPRKNERISTRDPRKLS